MMVLGLRLRLCLRHGTLFLSAPVSSPDLFRPVPAYAAGENIAAEPAACPLGRTLPAVLQKAPIMAAEAPATASEIESAAFSADTEDTKTPRNPSGIRGAPDDLDGAEGQNRTAHTGIFSPLLYQLSYLGTTKVNLLQSGPIGKNFF